MSLDCRGAEQTCPHLSNLQIELLQDYLTITVFFVVAGVVALHVYRHRSAGVGA